MHALKSTSKGLFRQTCVNIPVGIKRALEVEIVPVAALGSGLEKPINNMEQNRPEGGNPDAADFAGAGS